MARASRHFQNDRQFAQISRPCRSSIPQCLIALRTTTCGSAATYHSRTIVDACNVGGPACSELLANDQGVIHRSRRGLTVTIAITKYTCSTAAPSVKSSQCHNELILAVTSRLKKPTVYPRPSLRTKRYCSAVSYALLNFQ